MNILVALHFCGRNRHPRSLDCCSRRNSTSSIPGVVFQTRLYHLLPWRRASSGRACPMSVASALGTCPSVDIVFCALPTGQINAPRQLLLRCSTYGHPALMHYLHSLHPCKERARNKLIITTRCLLQVQRHNSMKLNYHQT